MDAQHSTISDKVGAGLTQQTRSVLDGLPIGVVLINQSQHIAYANPAAIDLLGRNESASALLSESLISEPDIDWPRLLSQVKPNCAPIHLEAQVANQDDQPQSVTVDIHAQPFGGVAALGVIIRVNPSDSELRRQLAVAQSLAAVGRLAARVAHELNNPLDGVLRYVSLARRMISDQTDPRADEYLVHAATGLKRMARIVTELLEFSRSHSDYRETECVSQIVEDAIHLHRDQADDQNVVIAAGFRDSDVAVPDSGRLLQVCSNLIKNAIDAMPDGGCLTVTAGRRQNKIVICVEDTGVGLGGNVDRVFDPFYTTKPSGKGTGLGLAICRDYVRQLGGDIAAANGEEGGAVFTVTVPIADSESHERLNKTNDADEERQNV